MGGLWSGQKYVQPNPRSIVESANSFPRVAKHYVKHSRTIEHIRVGHIHMITSAMAFYSIRTVVREPLWTKRLSLPERRFLI